MMDANVDLVMNKGVIAEYDAPFLVG